jgi:hypothetical protein
VLAAEPTPLDRVAGGVRELAAQVEALADQHDRPHASERVRTAAARAQATPTVVVAGEVGRGKSRLVNALIARPGLLPVDDDGGTGAYIVVEHSPQPFARVHLSASDTPTEIELDEIAEWASVEANPGNERGVRWVHVGVARPFLQGLRIIDTPGVGGLDGGHALLTLEALKSADALLFVVEAGGALSRPELHFLQKAAAHINTVVIALARVDLHPGWEVVARDDASLLAQHAPRFSTAPLVPVSSLLAEHAMQMGPDAESLREESGIVRLRRILVNRVAKRPRVLRLESILRACEEELEPLEDELVREIATSGADPKLRSALEAEQARLSAFTRDSAQWRFTLEHAVRRVTMERADELRRGLSEIQARFTEAAVATRGKRDMQALPAQVMSEVTALAIRVSQESTRRVEEVAEGIVGELQASPEVAEAVRRAASAGLEGLDGGGLPPPRAATAADRLSTVMSFMAGHSLALGLPAVGLAIGAAPLAVVSLGVGLVFSFVLSRGRGDAAARSEFRIWLREQISTAQTRLTSEFSRHLVDVSEEMRNVILQRIEVQQTEIASGLAAMRRAQEEDAASRRRRAAAAQAEVARIRALLTRCGALRRQLAAAHAGTPVEDGAPG